MSKSMLRYCVKCPDGELRLDCMENEPTLAMRAFIDSHNEIDEPDLDDNMARWNWFRQKGYRMIRVRIEELEPKMVSICEKEEG